MDFKQISKNRQDAIHATYLEQLSLTGMSGLAVKKTAVRFGVTTSRVYQILRKY